MKMQDRRCTLRHDVLLDVCRVICTKVVGATSSEGILVINNILPVSWEVELLGACHFTWMSTGSLKMLWMNFNETWRIFAVVLGTIK